MAEPMEANDRLKELDYLKSEFVSLASHALRSPLASMKMGVATVLHEMVGPLNDEQKQMLQIAERNIDRLTDLSSELLDLTRIEADALDLVPEEIDLCEVASEVVASELSRAMEKGLMLEVVRPASNVRVRCDRERMHQVIWNFVDNALRFTDEGRVVVALFGNDEEVTVEVSDTGLGIEEDAVDGAFDKWSRAYTESSSERRGTGLGLAICRGIVEAHGGKIALRSKLGRGTKVSFTVPSGTRKCEGSGAVPGEMTGTDGPGTAAVEN